MFSIVPIYIQKNNRIQMKKSIFIILMTFIGVISRAQVTVTPDTIKIGQTNNVVFSGSGINFSQGTCIYVFLVQGTSIISQNASSTYQAGSNILSASFTVASNIANGLWDVYIVDICSGSWTGNPLISSSSVIASYMKKMTLKSTSLIQSIVSFFDFEIFPNPVVNQSFKIKSTTTSIYKNYVNIRDLSGKNVKSFSYKGEETEISTSNLSNGIYFVEIFDETGNKTTKKIILE